MVDFEAIKNISARISGISSTLIDEFLVYYAAAKDRLDREFEQRIVSYRHITKRVDRSWVNKLKAQYIVHRIFKKDGLLRKYLNHVEIKRRPPEKLAFQHPWRFSFSVITESPAPDFYQMQDVFTGESFLLYSRSTTLTLQEHTPLLWFNLISFNGACWQTFGPVISYQSFDADDIFFYATEVSYDIEDDQTLLEDVEKNPIPYMVLLIGSRLPVTFNKEDELFMMYSEHEVETLDTDKLKKAFKVEYAHNVYRLTTEPWDQPPHLAVAYYGELEQLLAITSMTERSFEALTALLNQYGLNIPSDPQVRVHPTMFVTAEDILQKKIDLNPYDELFEPPNSPGQKAEMEKLNVFLQLALPAVNEGKTPDVEKLAAQAGIDPEVARQLLATAMARIEALRRGK